MSIFMVSENHESLYRTRHSSMSQTCHTCSVCGESIPHGVEAFIHAFTGSLRVRGCIFPRGLFVCHWEQCATKAGLR